MKFTKLMALTLTLAGTFAGQSLLAAGPDWNDRDVRNDRRELRSDYRDLHRDYAALESLRTEIRRDQWRLDDDLRHRRYWRVEQDRRDLALHRRQLESLERELRQDQREIRRDNQELRSDYRDRR